MADMKKSAPRIPESQKDLSCGAMLSRISRRTSLK